jgi:hypothetical protein
MIIWEDIARWKRLCYSVPPQKKCLKKEEEEAYNAFILLAGY